ncbi:inorganic diphosphatase [Luteimonas sp. TWI1437]|uniref:inorganic diphosphatase n=1 Tax=unclassified Luteimonas TaxID=2629088 RepID=UPI0032097FD4
MSAMQGTRFGMAVVTLMLGAGLSLAGAATWAAGPAGHPVHARQPDPSTHDALLVVEIPAGGMVKYEIGAEDGLLHVDRFVSMPVVYPANYGAMPGTRAGDGDPLDALVLTRAPVHPGALLRFRPLGVLRMRDGGQADEKIVGVPVDDVDPTYAGVRDLADLPAAERARIEAFFRVYKDLPEGSSAVTLHGWGDAAAARALIGDAIEAAGR